MCLVIFLSLWWLWIPFVIVSFWTAFLGTVLLWFQFSEENPTYAEGCAILVVAVRYLLLNYPVWEKIRRWGHFIQITVSCQLFTKLWSILKWVRSRLRHREIAQDRQGAEAALVPASGLCRGATGNPAEVSPEDMSQHKTPRHRSKTPGTKCHQEKMVASLLVCHACDLLELEAEFLCNQSWNNLTFHMVSKYFQPMHELPPNVQKSLQTLHGLPPDPQGDSKPREGTSMTAKNLGVIETATVLMPLLGSRDSPRRAPAQQVRAQKNHLREAGHTVYLSQEENIQYILPRHGRKSPEISHQMAAKFLTGQASDLPELHTLYRAIPCDRALVSTMQKTKHGIDQLSSDPQLSVKPRAEACVSRCFQQKCRLSPIVQKSLHALDRLPPDPQVSVKPRAEAYMPAETLEGEEASAALRFLISTRKAPPPTVKAVGHPVALSPEERLQGKTSRLGRTKSRQEKMVVEFLAGYVWVLLELHILQRWMEREWGWLPILQKALWAFDPFPSDSQVSMKPTAGASLPPKSPEVEKAASTLTPPDALRVSPRRAPTQEVGAQNLTLGAIGHPAVLSVEEKPQDKTPVLGRKTSGTTSHQEQPVAEHLPDQSCNKVKVHRVKNCFQHSRDLSLSAWKDFDRLPPDPQFSMNPTVGASTREKSLAMERTAAALVPPTELSVSPRSPRGKEVGPQKIHLEAAEHLAELSPELITQDETVRLETKTARTKSLWEKGVAKFLAGHAWLLLELHILQRWMEREWDWLPILQKAPRAFDPLPSDSQVSMKPTAGASLPPKSPEVEKAASTLTPPDALRVSPRRAPTQEVGAQNLTLGTIGHPAMLSAEEKPQDKTPVLGRKTSGTTSHQEQPVAEHLPDQSWNKVKVHRVKNCFQHSRDLSLSARKDFDRLPPDPQFSMNPTVGASTREKSLAMEGTAAALVPPTELSVSPRSPRGKEVGPQKIHLEAAELITQDETVRLETRTARTKSLREKGVAKFLAGYVWVLLELHILQRWMEREWGWLPILQKALWAFDPLPSDSQVSMKPTAGASLPPKSPEVEKAPSTLTPPDALRVSPRRAPTQEVGAPNLTLGTIGHPAMLSAEEKPQDKTPVLGRKTSGTTSHQEQPVAEHLPDQSCNKVKVHRVKNCFQHSRDLSLSARKDFDQLPPDPQFSMNPTVGASTREKSLAMEGRAAALVPPTELSVSPRSPRGKEVGPQKIHLEAAGHLAELSPELITQDETVRLETKTARTKSLREKGVAKFLAGHTWLLLELHILQRWMEREWGWLPILQKAPRAFDPLPSDSQVSMKPTAGASLPPKSPEVEKAPSTLTPPDALRVSPRRAPTQEVGAQNLTLGAIGHPAVLSAEEKPQDKTPVLGRKTSGTTSHQEQPVAEHLPDQSCNKVKVHRVKNCFQHSRDLSLSARKDFDQLPPNPQFSMNPMVGASTREKSLAMEGTAAAPVPPTELSVSPRGPRGKEVGPQKIHLEAAGHLAELSPELITQDETVRLETKTARTKSLREKGVAKFLAGHAWLLLELHILQRWMEREWDWLPILQKAPRAFDPLPSDSQVSMKPTAGASLPPKSPEVEKAASTLTPPDALRFSPRRAPTQEVGAPNLTLGAIGHPAMLSAEEKPQDKTPVLGRKTSGTTSHQEQPVAEHLPDQSCNKVKVHRVKNCFQHSRDLSFSAQKDFDRLPPDPQFSMNPTVGASTHEKSLAMEGTAAALVPPTELSVSPRSPCGKGVGPQKIHLEAAGHLAELSPELITQDETVRLETKTAGTKSLWEKGVAKFLACHAWVVLELHILQRLMEYERGMPLPPVVQKSLQAFDPLLRDSQVRMKPREGAHTASISLEGEGEAAAPTATSGLQFSPGRAPAQEVGAQEFHVRAAGHPSELSPKETPQDKTPRLGGKTPGTKTHQRKKVAEFLTNPLRTKLKFHILKKLFQYKCQLPPIVQKSLCAFGGLPPVLQASMKPRVGADKAAKSVGVEGAAAILTTPSELQISPRRSFTQEAGDQKVHLGAVGHPEELLPEMLPQDKTPGMKSHQEKMVETFHACPAWELLEMEAESAKSLESVGASAALTTPSEPRVSPKGPPAQAVEAQELTLGATGHPADLLPEETKSPGMKSHQEQTAATFLSNQFQSKLKFHIAKKWFQHKCGLPPIVQKSLCAFDRLPPVPQVSMKPRVGTNLAAKSLVGVAPAFMPPSELRVFTKRGPPWKVLTPKLHLATVEPSADVWPEARPQDKAPRHGRKSLRMKSHHEKIASKFLEGHSWDLLEFHILQRRIQHDWELPPIVQKSLQAFHQLPPDPQVSTKPRVHAYTAAQSPDVEGAASALAPPSVLRVSQERASTQKVHLRALVHPVEISMEENPPRNERKTPGMKSHQEKMALKLLVGHSWDLLELHILQRIQHDWELPPIVQKSLQAFDRLSFDPQVSKKPTVGACSSAKSRGMKGATVCCPQSTDSECAFPVHHVVVGPKNVVANMDAWTKKPCLRGTVNVAVPSRHFSDADAKEYLEADFRNPITADRSGLPRLVHKSRRAFIPFPYHFDVREVENHGHPPSYSHDRTLPGSDARCHPKATKEANSVDQQIYHPGVLHEMEHGGGTVSYLATEQPLLCPSTKAEHTMAIPEESGRESSRRSTLQKIPHLKKPTERQQSMIFDPKEDPRSPSLSPSSSGPQKYRCSAFPRSTNLPSTKHSSGRMFQTASYTASLPPSSKTTLFNRNRVSQQGGHDLQRATDGSHHRAGLKQPQASGILYSSWEPGSSKKECAYLTAYMDGSGSSLQKYAEQRGVKAKGTEAFCSEDKPLLSFGLPSEERHAVSHAVSAAGPLEGGKNQRFREEERRGLPWRKGASPKGPLTGKEAFVGWGSNHPFGMPGDPWPLEREPLQMAKEVRRGTQARHHHGKFIPGVFAKDVPEKFSLFFVRVGLKISSFWKGPTSGCIAEKGERRAQREPPRQRRAQKRHDSRLS